MQGHYEVLERIAVGGMAEIYLGLARGEEGFSRPVVIKKVRPRLSGDARFVEMLIKEAKITASLNHPNIVQILDLGQNDEGEHFIVMEYVEGQDLRALIDEAQVRQLPIGIDRAVYIASEVCAGLHHAHRKTDEEGRPLKLIHRDVSPSNILISYAGEVKLTDFGIARYGREISTVGSLKGKLAYMSPEQARTQPVDHRSDIFSLSAILFELVLQRKLFPADNDLQVLEQVRSATIPLPSAIDPGLPLRLEHLLLRGLSPDPQTRFSDAEEMQAALREFHFQHSTEQVGARQLARLIGELFPERRGPGAPAAAPVQFTINTLSGLEVPPTASRRSFSVDHNTSVATPSPGLLLRLREQDRRDGQTTSPEASRRASRDRDLDVPLRSRRREKVPAAAPDQRRQELVRVLTQLPSIEVEIDPPTPPPSPASRPRATAEPPELPTGLQRRLEPETQVRLELPRPAPERPAAASGTAAPPASSSEVPEPVTTLHSLAAIAEPPSPPRSGAEGITLRTLVVWVLVPMVGLLLGSSLALYLVWRNPLAGSGQARRPRAEPTRARPAPVETAPPDRSVETALASSTRPDGGARSSEDRGSRSGRPVSQRASGRVVIKSEPWAYIVVDGRRTGLTTSARAFTLPAGTHQIELHNPALGLRRSFSLKVRAGELIRSFVRLEDPR